jgi:hypothetical protein
VRKNEGCLVVAIEIAGEVEAPNVPSRRLRSVGFLNGVTWGINYAQPQSVEAH